MESFRKWLITVLSITFSLFHLYTGGVGSFPDHIQRAIHVALILMLTYAVNPGRKEGEGSSWGVWLNMLLVFCSGLVGVYLLVNYDDIVLREGVALPMDIYIGILAIILVWEATRRVLGLFLASIAAIFLVYALIGPYLPGVLAHRGYPITRVAYQMYLTTSGIFGVPIGVSATMIALFVIFGAFLDRSGAGKIFTDLAFSLTGRARGGPAKAAVISSALMGTVSGSAAANVAVTGTFTIPLMKKTGYEPHFAGAVEAAASTGGQIMPPIMASAAFVMSELTGIPYVEICIAAILPAIFYFVTIYINVHLRAIRLNLTGSSREDLPRFFKTLAAGFHLILPLFILIYLLARMYSPGFVAFWSVVATILACYVKKETRMGPSSLMMALKDGGTRMIEVGVTCAVAGIIIGVINLTGLGVKFSTALIVLAGGNLFLLLILTMVASIILGMGMPTVAAYLLLAVLVGPALINMGLPILVAHLFILYFGTLSAITPPVALAAYTAAGIAKANPLTVGIHAVGLGIAAYILPFMFVYNQALLLQGSMGEIFLAILTALAGCYAISAAIQGQLRRRCGLIERLILFSCGLLLIKPGIWTDLLGLAGLSMIIFIQYRWERGKKKEGLSA